MLYSVSRYCTVIFFPFLFELYLTVLFFFSTVLFCLLFLGYFLSHLMPEDSWTEFYDKYDVLRLDCSRYIWPKLSFIRKCVALSLLKKEIIEKKREKLKIEKENISPILNDSQNKDNMFSAREISDDTKNNSPIYGNKSSSFTNSKLLKFEMHRNSHEKLKKKSPVKRKRNRESAYSEDEEEEGSSEEDDIGNSLFFRVSTGFNLFFDLKF